MLFLISSGDYTHSFEDKQAMQSVIVIEAQSPQDPHVQEAIDKFVACTPYDRDEVVVNPLGEPVEN
jgi:hypothetical protein